MTFSSDTLRSWVDVDLAALINNARKVKAVSGSRLLPMVKANGYGLGAVKVVRALDRLDPWGYGVASVDEAASLRTEGVARPLLVTTPFIPAAIDHFLELNLRPCIGDPVALDAWIARTARPFHIEIDTGMSRGGIRWDDNGALGRVRTLLRTADGWEGIYTHFVSAESDQPLTARQWERFQGVVDAMPRRPSLVHAANSAAALTGSTYAGDLVRPGIFLYGGAVGAVAPEPVAALRGRVVALRSIRPGDGVGYNATWRANRESTIATVAVGYADGFPRSPVSELAGESSREIELGSRRVPIVGRVTMDMCMAVVPAGIALGDVATIYGGLVSLDEQASMAGTVSYELLTRLGSRVSRRYQGLT